MQIVRRLAISCCLSALLLPVTASAAAPLPSNYPYVYPVAPFWDSPVHAVNTSDKTVKGSAVRSEHATSPASPVRNRTLINPPENRGEVPASPTGKERPWYETAWGIGLIGLGATGATMAIDKGTNHYLDTHLGYGFRDHTALNIADGLANASVIFAGLTWFESPWSSPRLAHASSVALTAAAITTVEVIGLKYAFGRERPSSPDSSPFHFHPFSSRYSVIGGGGPLGFGHGSSASFPSGHTAIAFAVVTPYAQIYHEPWLYAIPVTVGLARIAAVDGHWASDVVAGGFLGWLTADLTRRYFPKSNYGFMIFGDGVSAYGRF